MSRETARYQVEIGGSCFEVAIDGAKVTVDGEPFDGDVAAVGDSDYSALYERRSLNLTIEPTGELGGFEVGDGTRAHEVRVRDLRELARAAASGRQEARGGDGLVRASMPGIVTQLLVAGGEAVEIGQPLLILEAMKMENEIAAGTAGLVSAVHVAVGQSVTKGDKLIEVEPAKTPGGDGS